jgi:PHD/YefM family antitoxin component YafN of YafNO toxin-antitoxin module
MPQILPIKDLKDTAKISRICEESKEPVFVTKNGYGNLVIMSMEVYEELPLFSHLMNRLEKAEEDVVNDRVGDARQAITEAKIKYGL